MSKRKTGVGGYPCHPAVRTKSLSPRRGNKKYVRTTSIQRIGLAQTACGSALPPGASSASSVSPGEEGRLGRRDWIGDADGDWIIGLGAAVTE